MTDRSILYDLAAHYEVSTYLYRAKDTPAEIVTGFEIPGEGVIQFMRRGALLEAPADEFLALYDYIPTLPLYSVPHTIDTQGR